MFKKKIMSKSDSIFKNTESIEKYDSELWSSLKNEAERQEDHIELIASENYEIFLIFFLDIFERFF